MKPALLLILGPTGVGKSTIVRHLQSLDDRFRYIRPYTTRPLRMGETDKISVKDSEIEHLWETGELLVINTLYGIKYGTPRLPIEEAFKLGLFPLIDWPIQQIEVMNREYPGQLHRVYVKPPDFDTLENRLRERTDFDVRVEAAKIELECLKEGRYLRNIDFIVSNDVGSSEETALKIYLKYVNHCSID